MQAEPIAARVARVRFFCADEANFLVHKPLAVFNEGAGVGQLGGNLARRHYAVGNKIFINNSAVFLHVDAVERPRQMCCKSAIYVRAAETSRPVFRFLVDILAVAAVRVVFEKQIQSFGNILCMKNIDNLFVFLAAIVAKQRKRLGNVVKFLCFSLMHIRRERFQEQKPRGLVRLKILVALDGRSQLVQIRRDAAVAVGRAVQVELVER